jgi:hypothetical protein
MTEGVAGDLTDGFLCYVGEDGVTEFLEDGGANARETVCVNVGRTGKVQPIMAVPATVKTVALIEPAMES